MQARFYDPVVGRFLQADPIGYEDQLNLYAYVHNNPVSFYDPFGLQCKPAANTIGTSCDYTGSRQIDIDLGESTNTQEGPDSAGVLSDLNNAAGLLSTGALMSLVSGEKWKGKNRKWYNLSWGGNQWTGARSEIMRRANHIRAAGQGFFVLGTGLSLVEGADALSRGDSAGVVKSASDIGWGTAATFGGPVGFVGGMSYFGMSALVRIPAVDRAVVQPGADFLCLATSDC